MTPLKSGRAGRLTLTAQRDRSARPLQNNTRTHRHRRWTDDELEALNDAVCEAPYGAALVAVYQKLAEKRGLPHRSPTSIMSKAARCNWGHLETLSRRQLSDALGLSIFSIDWLCKKGLRSQKLSRNLRAFRVKDVMQFAKENPQRFQHLKPGKIERLLGEEVATAIATAPRPQRRRGRPMKAAA